MSRIQQKKINKVKKVVKDYINLLRENNFPVSAAYIYGSYARGNFHKNSDIDVCIISPKLAENWDENEKYLWRQRRFVDARIEPVGYSPEDFKNDWVPLVAEIKKHKIRIV